MQQLIKVWLFLAAFVLTGVLALSGSAWATGGGGGGGGGAGNGGDLNGSPELRRSTRTRRSTPRRIRKKPAPRSRARKSRSRKATQRRAAPVVVVQPATSVNQAAERANAGTDRCTRFNKQFTSRRICMTRMMKQFVKDLEANVEKLPKKTPAKVETVALVVESMAREKPKEETLSALEQARSAFAVSMELAKEEDPNEENGYSEAMQLIENVLENAYEALAQAS